MTKIATYTRKDINCKTENVTRIGMQNLEESIQRNKSYGDMKFYQTANAKNFY